MRKIFLSAALLATLASCSTTNYTYRTSDINNSNVIATDVVVDLKVDLENKIETTSGKHKTVELAKTEAYYKAIKENKVDVVVDPIFEITTTDKFLIFGGKNSVKLTGFGATYTNARTKIEAIKELKTVDTTAIKSFNSIYLMQTYPMQRFSGSSSLTRKAEPAPTSAVASSRKKEDADKKGKLGIKLGLSRNTFNFATFDKQQEVQNNGTFVGLIFDSNPNGGFGLRVEALRSFNEYESHTYIPVLASIGLGERFKVHVGPSLTIYDLEYFWDDLTGTSLGLDIGVSADLSKKLFADLRYSRSLSNLDYSGEGEIDYKSTTIGIGYRF